MVEVIGHHDHHLVAGTTQGHHRQPEGLTGADGQAQLIRCHLRPVAALVIGTQTFAHLQKTLVRGIAIGCRVIHQAFQISDKPRIRRMGRHRLTQIDQRHVAGVALGRNPLPNFGDGGEIDCVDQGIDPVFHARFITSTRNSATRSMSATLTDSCSVCTWVMPVPIIRVSMPWLLKILASLPPPAARTVSG